MKFVDNFWVWREHCTRTFHEMQQTLLKIIDKKENSFDYELSGSKIGLISASHCVIIDRIIDSNKQVLTVNKTDFSDASVDTLSHGKKKIIYFLYSYFLFIVPFLYLLVYYAICDRRYYIARTHQTW
jgi:hypothetical protein